MKLTHLAVCLGMMATCVSSAYAAKSVHSAVTRKTGGQLLLHTTDPGVYDIEVEMSSKDYKILVRSVSYLNSSGQTVAVSLAEIARNNAQMKSTTGGYFITPGDAPILFSLYEKNSNIKAIQLQAESFGGSGTLVVISEDARTGPAPTPVPTPRPPSDNSAERQCSKELPIVSEQVRQCDSRQDTAELRLQRYDDDLRAARERLSRESAPLDACRVGLANRRDRGSKISSELSDAIERKRSLGQELAYARAENAQAQSAKSGRSFRCVVDGRHQRFVGTGASAAKALQVALATCGEGNCGKGDFPGRYNCEIQ